MFCPYGQKKNKQELKTWLSGGIIISEKA